MKVLLYLEPFFANQNILNVIEYDNHQPAFVEKEWISLEVSHSSHKISQKKVTLDIFSTVWPKFPMPIRKQINGWVYYRFSFLGEYVWVGRFQGGIWVDDLGGGGMSDVMRCTSLHYNYITSISCPKKSHPMQEGVVILCIPLQCRIQVDLKAQLSNCLKWS